MTDVTVSVELDGLSVEIHPDGILVQHDGNNRFITSDEIAEMCETDAPVTIT